MLFFATIIALTPLQLRCSTGPSRAQQVAAVGWRSRGDRHVDQVSAFAEDDVVHLGRSFVALGALGVAVAGTNLVQNGGFELTTGLDPDVFNENTGIDDWVIGGDNPGINLVMPANVQTTTAIQYLWGPTNATPVNNGLTVSPVGGNFIAQDGDYYYHGTISQTINGLTPGKKYDVSFYWAVAQAAGFGFPGGNVDNQYFVSLGTETQSTALVTVPYQGFSGWMPENFVFTATDLSEDLSFLAEGGVAIGIPPMALLDGVSMTAVPEPSTWAMLLTGFGGLAFAARLRRRMTKAPRVKPARSPG
jgi:PEP-CTERM motif